MFSSKTPRDVICERELRHILGDRCLLTCTGAAAPGYEQRRIDRAFLEEKIQDIKQRFYVCGPPPFMEAVNAGPGRSRRQCGKPGVRTLNREAGASGMPEKTERPEPPRSP